MRGKKLRFWLVAIMLASFAVVGLTWHQWQGAALGQAAAKKTDDGRDADREAIRKSSRAFADAFEKGDAKAVAAFFTEQGEFIGEDGVMLRGRGAIAKAYAEFFAKYPKHKVTAEIDTIRFPSKSTAIEEGHFRVRKVKGGEAVTSRYSILHVKETDHWEMAVLREWPDDGVSLRDIDWLIGTWAATSKDTEVRTKYRWNPEKTFILMDFVIKEKDQPERKGTSTIARDASTGQLRSWQFESQGGFGEAVWERDGRKWLQEATGILPDGSKLSALNVLTAINADSFIWQSTNRTLDGAELPDLAPIKVNRVKSEK